MSAAKSYFLFGDSHVQVFKDVAREYTNDNAQRCFFAETVGPGRIVNSFVFTDSEDNKVISPSMTIKMEERLVYPFKKFNKRASENKIIVLLATGEGVRMSLNSRWNTYDWQMSGGGQVVQAAGEGKEQEIEVIPNQVIYGFLKWRLKQFFEGMIILKEEGYKDIAILASPPPHASNDRILSLYNAKKQGDPDFNKNAFMPAQASIRMKLHEVNEQLIRDFCAEEGFEFIENPDFVKDENGFLLEKYERDGVHANVDYARDMINYIMGNTSES